MEAVLLGHISGMGLAHANSMASSAMLLTHSLLIVPYGTFPSERNILGRKTFKHCGNKHNHPC
jgi:hypothetical protein